MDFEYFFFKPLGFEELVKALNSTYNNFSHDSLKGIYAEWLIDYCRKSQYFYQYQYRKHSEVTWAAFCTSYSILEYDDPSNFGLDIEWRDWKEEYSLNIHYDQYQDIRDRLTHLQETAQQNIDTKSSIYIEEMVPYKEIDRVWFNLIINNSPQKIDELRKISHENYEKYRQTTHWKRVRAAMLLISQAVCQDNECSLIGESWYGGNEAEVEVHHLNYSNIGNERFEELTLLCRKHHGLLHTEPNNQ